MTRARHKVVALGAVGALTAASALTAGALGTACDDRRSYVYTGARYDETAACLAPYSSLEVVPGEGASAKCAPRCVAFEGALYVSTVCPPLPRGAELVAADAGTCIAALRALQEDASCAEGQTAIDGSPATPDGATLPPEDGSATVTPDAASDAATPMKDAGPG
jgi:hypothetical protein